MFLSRIHLTFNLVCLLLIYSVRLLTISSLFLQGFTLEDATGLAIKGDVDVHSVFATSLPTSHPSFSPQRVLEMSPKWKSQPLPNGPIPLFIGVLSATNHFAERMAVRKSWMQASAIKSSIVAVRFFVALVWPNINVNQNLSFAYTLISESEKLKMLMNQYETGSFLLQ